MKSLSFRWPALIALAFLLFPELAAAAGGKAADLIVVADNRSVDWVVAKWWIDHYNTSGFMFGLWCTIFTAALGVSLGLITDFLMKHTGIDLTSRKIVEH